MSKPTSLPLYKTTTDFIKLLYHSIEVIKKPYKFEIAKDIRITAYQLLIQIQKINEQTNNSDRIKEQNVFIKNLNAIEILLQLCTELKLVKISGKQSIYPVMLKEKEVEKQIYKWKNFTMKNVDGKTKGVANSPYIDAPHNVSMLSNKQVL